MGENGLGCEVQDPCVTEGGVCFCGGRVAGVYVEVEEVALRGSPYAGACGTL